jgi:mycothiol system anti-sigma-R factor
MPSRQPRAANGAPTSAWITTAADRLGVTEGTIRRWVRAGRLNPSCGAVYAKVFEYLDRELSSDERAEIEHHIEACPGCEEHFAFDGAVLRFVRQRAPRALCPPAVQERLLAPFRDRAVAEPGG